MDGLVLKPRAIIQALVGVLMWKRPKLDTDLAEDPIFFSIAELYHMQFIVLAIEELERLRLGEV